MRKLKLISLMLILALSMQVSVFATNSLESTAQDNTTKSVTVQPRGRYLQSGGCTITPHKGYVPSAYRVMVCSQSAHSHNCPLPVKDNF